MKKTLILVATAFVACVACNKEIENPAPQANVTSITAVAPDTKTTVDGFQVQWTTGDQVALFQTSGAAVPFTLQGEGPVTTGTFASSAAVSPNGLAAFPAEGASNTGSKISVVIPSEFPYGTSPVPMVGVLSSGTTFNFSLACGAAEIDIKDVPPYPCNLVLISDKNITGTLEIPDYTNPSSASFASEGAGNTITVTGIPRGQARILVPLPAGTHSLKVALVAAADGTSIVPRSNKAKDGVEVVAGKICNLKQIDLEEGGKAPLTKTADGAFNLMSLPGTWIVRGNAGDKNGLVVLGRGGAGNDYLAFLRPDDKYWCWNKVNYSYKNEFDNELTISVAGLSAPIQGTFTWTGGADGKFWDYTWNHSGSSGTYAAFNGTDLSAYYDRIPRGEHSGSLDISTWDVTFDTGEKAHVLAAGTYAVYNRTLTIPDNCFALMFHIGNLKPMNPTPAWQYQDIDCFFFSPLEYIIIFEKKS